MPQLDPTPWFLVLIFSWAVFLTIIPPKVMAHLSPNKPAQKDTKEACTLNWAWPWQ
uniref:ATP synthase complex subunit 8 n=1 Tax=Ichthyscopus lebeck TaxID=270582 RepID=A0A679EPH3_9TELE|nr:ATPase subunit 8 [Ichthyscopus lebeck]